MQGRLTQGGLPWRVGQPFDFPLPSRAAVVRVSVKVLMKSASAQTLPWKWLVVLQGLTAAVAVAVLVVEIGWPLDDTQAATMEFTTWVLVGLSIVAEVGVAIFTPQKRSWQRYAVVGSLLVLAVARLGLGDHLRHWFGLVFEARAAVLATLAVIQLSIVIPAVLHLMQLAQGRLLQKTRPGLLFAGSFLFAMVAGLLLLKMPNASRHGLTWLDAAFTSTSAVCVTGLAVVDTEHDLTFTGQAILLGLIQLGGLGVMTLTYFIALVAGQGVSMRDHARLGDLLSEENLSHVAKFLRSIVLLTLAFEILGAVGLHQVWLNHPPRDSHLWWDASFHAVSAFCNAGFSTFSAGLGDPSLSQDRSAQVILMVLIVAGGLGFAVLADLPTYGWRLLSRTLGVLFPRWQWLRRPAVRVRLHTRLALRVTLILLLSGALLFFVTERWSLTSEHCWEALFNTVTLRTAGFNISDFGAYGFATVVVCCFLMFIGGCPGGTAGGVKTTTLAIAVAELGRILRGHHEVHLIDRSVSRAVVERSLVTLFLSMLWLTVSAVLVSMANPDLDPENILFECVSAFGTVGLSRGITAELAPWSKVVIILNMFVGRIGILTFALAVAGTPVPRRFSLPEAGLPLN